MKICKKCGSKDHLYTQLCRGRVQVRPICRRCEADRSKQYDKTSCATRTFQRANMIDVEGWILKDSRKSDKKRGLRNGMTRELIRSQIVNGCHYCGEDQLRMTLDRIDNSEGHVEGNVVGACIRCNYARRSMPFKAWLCLVDGMRKARSDGLFGTWTGRCR